MTASAFLDLVLMTVTGAPGTGDITLGAPKAPYIGIANYPTTVPDGTQVSYSITDGLTASEVGRAIYRTPAASSTTYGKLTGRTIIASCSSGTSAATAINASANALVRVVQLGEDFSFTQISGVADPSQLPTAPFANVAWPPYNVVSGGSTDYTTQIQNAMNAVGALGGGDVILPAGSIVAKGLTGVAGVRLLGVGQPSTASGLPASFSQPQSGTVLTSNGADATVITINTSACVLERLQIIGGGPASTTNPAVLLSSSAMDTFIDRCNITGGTYALELNGAAVTRLKGTFVGQSYGSAALYCVNAGGLWLDNCFINQPWDNVGFPAANSTITARSNSLVVTAGELISYTDGAGKQWLLHVKTAGTTASTGSGPTVLAYGNLITDGTAAYYLRAPLAYYGLQWDSGCSVLEAQQTDFSGAHTSAIAVTNTVSPFTVPQSLIITDSCTSSNFMSNAIVLLAGRQVIITAGRFNQATLASTAIISTATTFGGDLTIANCEFKTATTGIAHAGGTHVTIRDNRFGGLTNCVTANAVTDWTVIGNDIGGNSVGSTNTNGVTTTGACDYYTIAYNSSHGCTTPVNDGASGTHKTIKANIQAVPLFVESSLFNPTGNSTTAREMQGMAFQFTPQTTGNLKVTVNANLTNATDQAQASARMLYGTGTPPVNGVGETGTVLGNAMNSNVSGANGQNNTCATHLLTGLTVGTTYWLDMSLKSSVSSSLANLFNVTFVLEEQAEGP
jgi:hypothetical protein